MLICPHGLPDVHISTFYLSNNLLHQDLCVKHKANIFNTGSEHFSFVPGGTMGDTELKETQVS